MPKKYNKKKASTLFKYYKSSKLRSSNIVIITN